MRIAGITIPEQKRIEVALTAIYGVGRRRAEQILAEAAVAHGKKAADLTEQEEGKIRQAVEKRPIEGALKREIAGNIKRLIDIKSYRGSRHIRKLPSRGQRTKTNSRTRRGNVRRTMGSGRKASSEKT